ncbi:MAG TPA: hypothetical protein VH878_05195 [Thermodesulfobacteriota bacterium]|jgi:uncharacterized protein (UPF0128 family)
MDYVRKTYVEYLVQGGITNENIVEEVPDREFKNLLVPEKAYGFRFFDMIIAHLDIDEATIELRSKRINESHFYYYGGRVWTLEEVTNDLPNNDKLLLYMNINGWDKVIQTRTGQFLEFKKDDVIIG